MAELMHGQVVKKVHVLAMHDDEQLRELFNLSFSERDESLYLRPKAPTVRYFCGAERIPEGVKEYAFPFTGQLFTDESAPAKLSIHASGQVHARADTSGRSEKAGAVFMPPLNEMRDQNIAQVSAERVPSRRQPGDHYRGPRG